MLRRIKQKLLGKNNKELFQKTLRHLITISKRHKTVVLYGSPTEGNWLGIANATKGLFPENALEIPQWYSNPVFTAKESALFCDEIIDLGFEKVIISGFASYFFDWIEVLAKSTIIEIIFHGTISEFHDKDKQYFIGKLIRLTKQNKIKRLGFVKKDLAEVFKKLYGFDCYHQSINDPVIPHNIKKIQLDKSKIHIGVFGADTFNKNLHNQVIHALMIENTVVHVLDKSIFSYLDKDDRIVAHGNNLSREKFLGILGSMDINLYMSYNESWGLIAYESEAMRIPVLRIKETDYSKTIKDTIENRK